MYHGHQMLYILAAIISPRDFSHQLGRGNLLAGKKILLSFETFLKTYSFYEMNKKEMSTIL